MRLTYLSIASSIIYSSQALPTFMTIDYPNQITVTQTIHPRGWTNTVPTLSSIMTTNTQSPYQTPSERPDTYDSSLQAQITTSWETNYQTTVVEFSELGLYTRVPGCPDDVIAFMPTTVTCSLAVSTGRVGYLDDLSCSSCQTTLAVVKPIYSSSSTITRTYVTIWTEVYYRAGATTSISTIGQVITTDYIPGNVVPYTRSSFDRNAALETSNIIDRYPTIDFSNSDVFRGTASVGSDNTIYNQGSVRGPMETISSMVELQSQDGYPNINFSNSEVFRGTATIGTDNSIYTNGRPRGAITVQETSISATGSDIINRPSSLSTSYEPSTTQIINPNRPISIDFNDPNQFRGTSDIEIISATIQHVVPTLARSGFSIPTNSASNYNSIDPAASTNFQVSSTGITSINSQTSERPEPTITTTEDSGRSRIGYSSIDYNNSDIFSGLNLDGGLSGSSSTAV